MFRLIALTGWLMIFFFSGCGLGEGKTGNKDVTISQKTSNDELLGPIMEFASPDHDFGVVREGEKVGWYFKYRNTGDKDLLIKAANATCGCTVPEYSKEPLPPGKEGMIKVVFDTSGRIGKQSKTISIESNDKNRVTQLKVTAEVTGR